MLPPRADHVRPPLISASEIRAAINGFPNGSAGGPDGMRPGYLKELLGALTGVDSDQFCEVLAGVGDLMLAGAVPETVRAVLYGANLFAFRKKDGGIRPIAVGLALRRLTARVTSRRLNHLGEAMRPTQLGFATKGGAEAAVHAARSFIESHIDAPEPRAFVKLDVKNAFNCLDRTSLLHSVQEKLPEYLPLFFQCYGAPTLLFTGGDTLASERGVQQGDPLGPVGYCATTHDAHQNLKSELVIGFLDDDVIAGEIDDVVSDIQTLTAEYGKMGLELNLVKCELFLMGGTEEQRANAKTKILLDVGDMICCTAAELKYLGSPLLDEALVSVMDSHIATASRLVGRAESLNAHTALYLVTNCLGPAKVLYTLRTSRAYKRKDLLKAYDDIITGKISNIANSPIDRNASNQIGLPFSFGGCGIRRTEELALPAFLASAYSVKTLVGALGPFEADEYTRHAQTVWTELAKTESPNEVIRKDQKAWDVPLLQSKLDILKRDTAADPTSRARLLAAATPESAAALRTLPAETLGTRLDDTTVRTMMALRLGAVVCKPHQCVCGQWADAYGHHAMVCGVGGARLKCHRAMNEIIARALQSAGFQSELEPPGLSDLDNKRPDGQTIGPYKGGKRFTWDCTVLSTTAVSHIAATSMTAGSAAARAEEHKTLHYEDLTPHMIFEPLGFETLGSWGPHAIQTVNDIGKRLQAATGEKRATEYLRQRLSLEIQRGNALRIMGTKKEGDNIDEIFSVIRPMRRQNRY